MTQPSKQPKQQLLTPLGKVVVWATVALALALAGGLFFGKNDCAGDLQDGVIRRRPK